MPPPVSPSSQRQQDLLEDPRLALRSHQVHAQVTNVEAVLHEACRHPCNQEGVAVVDHRTAGLDAHDQSVLLKVADHLDVETTHGSQLLEADAHRPQIAGSAALPERPDIC